MTHPTRRSGNVLSGWQQGIMTLRDQRLILLLLLWQSMVRGSDYYRGGEYYHSDEFALLAAAFSPQAIGLGFIIPAVTVLCGIVFNVHVLAWLGHWLLSLTYLTVSTSVLIVISNDNNTRGWQWSMALAVILILTVLTAFRVSLPPRGFWKTAGAVVMVAVFLYVVLTNPTPLASGLRFFGHFLTIGVIHAYWALRMGPVPLDPSDPHDAKAVLAIVAQDDHHQGTGGR